MFLVLLCRNERSDSVIMCREVISGPTADESCLSEVEKHPRLAFNKHLI